MTNTLLRQLAALIFVASAFATFPSSASAQLRSNSIVTTAQTRAELMAYAPQGLAPGQPIWLGLQLTHQAHWHSYWKNSGDSGLPTQLQWTLPEGVSAGAIDWPLPHRIPLGTLMNYGYEGTVLLPVPLAIHSGFKPPPGGLQVKLKASWLVCRLECIPEEGVFELAIPAQSSSALNQAAFVRAFAARPRPLGAQAAHIEVVGQSLQVKVMGLPADWQGKTVHLFPETPELLAHATTTSQAWHANTWTAQIPLSDQRSSSPQQLALVLELERQGYRVEAAVQGTWPALEPRAALSPALQAALQNNRTSVSSSLTLAAALLGALLGGLILNLMPCVFPVLAIKVVSLTRHANDHRSHRISGLAYSAGVILSFVGLGLLMLGLRSAGESLGWGFQLQNPAVVASLAALFTLIALNLSGVFEFGQFLPSSLASLQSRHPVFDSFLTGVLAVAVASPCSAPFMGAALGLAMSLPALHALLIFASLGLGLALPFLVLSLHPAFARTLPRPGAWMVNFRHFLAFPMFTTVVWLVWVLGQQTGIDGAAALLVLLVLLSAVLWSLTLRGRSRWISTSLLLVLASWALWTIGPSVTRLNDQRAEQNRDPLWQPWQPGLVEKKLANGQAVLVDFTAAWCVSCQYNKQTTLANPDVLADIRHKNVALLRADWTRRDSAITEALRQLGRNGVPVYVIYQKDKPPHFLSEILNVAEVRAALASL